MRTLFDQGLTKDDFSKLTGIHGRMDKFKLYSEFRKINEEKSKKSIPNERIE